MCYICGTKNNKTMATMKIKTLIDKLTSKYEECGNVDVKIVSDDYFMSIHNIEDVRNDTTYNHNVEIVITR